MQVNGTVLEEFDGVTLLKVNIQPCDIITYLEWLKGASDPIETAIEEFNFSSIEIKMLLLSPTQYELEKLKSNIQSIFRKGTLFYNDFYYDFVLQGASNRQILDYSCEYSVILQGRYKYKKEITINLKSVLSQKVIIEGNLKTPVIYEIISKTTIIDFTINGINVHDFALNKKLVIDGEKCLITLDGVNKFTDVELDEFPNLVPGMNTIVLNNTNCNLALRYKPRFI